MSGAIFHPVDTCPSCGQEYRASDFDESYGRFSVICDCGNALQIDCSGDQICVLNEPPEWAKTNPYLQPQQSANPFVASPMGFAKVQAMSQTPPPPRDPPPPYSSFLILSKADRPWRWKVLTRIVRAIFGKDTPDFLANYTTTLKPPILWTPAIGDQRWEEASTFNHTLILEHEGAYLKKVYATVGTGRIALTIHTLRLFFSKAYRQRFIRAGWKANLRMHRAKANGAISEETKAKILARWTGSEYGHAFTETEAQAAWDGLIDELNTEPSHRREAVWGGSLRKD